MGESNKKQYKLRPGLFAFIVKYYEIDGIKEVHIADVGEKRKHRKPGKNV